MFWLDALVILRAKANNIIIMSLVETSASFTEQLSCLQRIFVLFMIDTGYIHVYLPIFFGWGGVAEDDEAPPVGGTCFCVWSPLLLAATEGCGPWPWIYDKQCITLQTAMHTILSLPLECLQLFTFNAKSHKI